MLSKKTIKNLLTIFNFFLLVISLIALFALKTTEFFHITLGLAITLVFLSGLIYLGINAIFKTSELDENQMKALSVRDRATGLFHKQSLLTLLDQEIARAKRHKYPISIVLIKFISVDQIQKAFGQLAADRFLYQISETLKKLCRSYDGVFKFDYNSFILVLPETPPNVIQRITDRYQNKIERKKFLIGNSKEKSSPDAQFGAACFPLNGNEAGELIEFSEQTLSKRFDANVIYPQTQPAPQAGTQTKADRRQINPEEQKQEFQKLKEQSNSTQASEEKPQEQTKPEKIETKKEQSSNDPLPDVVQALTQEDETSDSESDVVTVDFDNDVSPKKGT